MEAAGVRRHVPCLVEPFDAALCSDPWTCTAYLMMICRLGFAGYEKCTITCFE